MDDGVLTAVTWRVHLRTLPALATTITIWSWWPRVFMIQYSASYEAWQNDNGSLTRMANPQLGR